MPRRCNPADSELTDQEPIKETIVKCQGCSPFKSSVVNGVNLDSLGAEIDEPFDYDGYEETLYGYKQTDPKQPGPDYLILVEKQEQGFFGAAIDTIFPNPIKEEAERQKKHYMRNIELANLIREGKIPTHLDEFMKTEYANYELLPEGKSVYHMNGEDGGYNVKLVNDRKLHGYDVGQLEVVYSTVTGKLDLSPENMPTINRAGPQKPVRHAIHDVVGKTYWSYGNTPHDSTNWYRRRVGPGSPDQSDPKKKANYDNIRKQLSPMKFKYRP